MCGEAGVQDAGRDRVRTSSPDMIGRLGGDDGERLLEKITLGRVEAMDFPLRKNLQNSLVVQWLGLWAFTAEGLGWIPGWGSKIPQAAWSSRKKERERKEGRKKEKKKLALQLLRMQSAVI